MSNEQKDREEELWQRAKEFDGIPRAESYYELSKIAYEREEYPEALNMCLIAKEIFEKDQANEYTTEILNLYQGIVGSYECLEECDKAEEALREAVDLAREKGDDSLGSLLRQLGRLYFGHSKYEESIECHSEAMALPIVDEKHHIGIDYVNIGMSYQRLKNYEEAVRYEKIALDKFYEDDVEPFWLVNIYGELCESYVGLQMADEILYYGQRALDWWLMENNYQKCWILKYYLAIGHRIKGDLEQALYFLKGARDLVVEHSRHPHDFLVDVDKEEGEILIMQGKVSAGQELIRRSKNVQSIIDEVGTRHILIDL